LAERPRPGWKLSIGVFVAAVYGGYFRAAAGVLLIAGLGLAVHLDVDAYR